MRFLAADVLVLIPAPYAYLCCTFDQAENARPFPWTAGPFPELLTEVEDFVGFVLNYDSEFLAKELEEVAL